MDRFINKRVIANGSFGKIVCATDTINNIKVVLKILTLNGLDTKLSSELKAEILVSKMLTHKNIVKYIDTLKNDKYLVLVYEYCNNGTLTNLMKQLKKETDYQVKEEKIKSIMLQLKNALNYLYDNTILHRDLKPDNILFNMYDNNEFVLKLADFGFSRIFNKNAVTDIGHAPLIQTYCGTPIYMAPELLIQNTYNVKADLWSTGIILYEMMYGMLPYKNIRTFNDLKTIIENKKIYIDEQHYSMECVNLLKSLLEYDPVKRITWEDFFKHNWFTTPIGISSELFFTANSEIISNKSSIIEQKYDIVTHNIKCYDVTESCVMIDFF